MNNLTKTLAVAALSLAFLGSGADAAPRTVIPEAAVLVCSTSGTDPIVVMNYSGSTGAPAIATGSDCATAIATLLEDGFALHTARDGDLRGGFYVFIRK